MANLPENTAYNANTQPSIANFSGIMRMLQQKTNQTATKTSNLAIGDSFKPATPTPSTQTPTPTAPSDFNPSAWGIPSTDTTTPPATTPAPTNLVHFDPTVASAIFSPQVASTPKAPAPNLFADQPIGPQGEGKVQPLPKDYNQFIPVDKNNNWVAPTPTAELRNWPMDLGGGQYIIDPSQPGKMIKSGRGLIPDAASGDTGIRSSILGKANDNLVQIDHIIPLWLGGADTLANLQILNNVEHEKKTAIQAVSLTLLANKKIDLNQARLMALSWNSKNDTPIPTPDSKGYIPLKDAERIAQDWQDNPKGSTLKENFGAAFKDTMTKLGNSVPVLGEFAKGLVGGGTAGIVPDTGANPETGAVGQVSNIAGNIVGTITGLGLLSKGVKALKVATGIGRGVVIAEDAMKTAGLATDIGSLSAKGIANKTRAATLTKMASSAGLLSLWGQLGETGKNISGQEQFNFKNHVTQFLSDVAYGGLLGSSAQTIKGYAKVGLGATALSLIEGQDIVPALQNGALMSALHGMGYQKGIIDPKTQIGNEEAYKASATAFNQYLGSDFLPVKKGQPIPQILQIEPAKIDQLKSDYQKAHPEDHRYDNLSNTDSAGAIELMGRNARSSFMDSVLKSDGKISQDDIKKELTRLTVSENQLTNQTLPTTERDQKELKDLLSMGEKLRPQTQSSQFRPAIDATKMLDNIPVQMPEKTYPNTDGTKFMTGNVPTTGYGDNIDVNAKATINDFYNNPNKYSNKLFIVKDPETAKVMRLIYQEQVARGEKVTVGNPDDALRVFVKSSDGSIHPVGYMPQLESFDIKKNNLNKTYYEITNRLRRTIMNAKSPEALQTALAKDKAGISLNIKDAQSLFDGKTTLKDMSDEELYSILKPVNAFEKYNSSLNNSAISQEMDKNGLNVLVVDKNKLMPSGAPFPRTNPENPYISLSLNEQDWLRSLDLKNGPAVTPEQQAVKNITSKQKSQEMAKTSGKILEKVAPKNAEKSAEPPTGGFTKEELRSLRKQGFSDEMIQKIQAKPVVTKPISTTYTPPVETPRGEPVLAPKTPQDVISTPETTNTPEPVKSAPEVPKKGVIQDLVNRSKLTADEAAPYIAKENEIARLNEEVKTRYLKPSEQNNMLTMGREIKKFLIDKGLTKPLQKTFTPKPIGLKDKNSNDLLNSAIQNASGDMDSVKGRSVSQTPEIMMKALNNVASRSMTILRENKLGLSPDEQKNLETAFKENVSNLVQDRVDRAFQGSISLPTESNPEGQKYENRPNVEPKEKKPVVFADEQLAKDWNLKLNDKRGLALDKKGQPSFSDEYSTKLGIKEGTNPRDWIEQNAGKKLADLFQKSLDANNSSKTVNSESFIKGIDSASKDPTFGPLWKTIRKIIDMTVAGDYKTPLNKNTFDERLKGSISSKAEKNWKLNSIFKNSSPFIQKLFDTVNAQGYDISQPKQRIFATNEKALKEIDAQTKATEAAAKEAKLERDSSIAPEGSQGSSSSDNLPEGVSKEDLSNMSHVDVNQAEKIHDLTKMESMFSSMQYQELTGKNPPVDMLVNDAIKWGKDFISNYNSSIRPNTKTKKAYIDKESWNKLRSYMTDTLSKKDGQGGPYDGKGGILSDIRGGLSNMWGGIKDMFTAKINYTDSQPTTPTDSTQNPAPQAPSPVPAPIKPQPLPNTPAQPTLPKSVPVTNALPAQPPAVKALTPSPTPLKAIPVKPIVPQPVKQPIKTIPTITPKEVSIPKPTKDTVIMGINLANYAEDPKWLNNVKTMVSSMQDVSTPDNAQAEISRVSPNSKITGKIVVDAANKYGVDPKLVLSILRQESNIGTSTRAIKTGNPGSILLLENGFNNAYKSMKDGVEAVARELLRRKVSPEDLSQLNANGVYPGIKSDADIQNTKNEVFKQYPFSNLARSYINEASITKLPQGQSQNDILMSNVSADGQMTPKGANFHNFITKYVAPFSSKFSDFILNNTGLLQNLDKANIEISNTDPKILAHEMLHQYFENSPMSTKNPDGSVNENAGSFGSGLLNTWDEVSQSDPDSPLAQINNRISQDYNTQNMAYPDIASERFAYLGEMVAEYGPKIIPKELRPYYSQVFDLPKANK